MHCGASRLTQALGAMRNVVCALCCLAVNTSAPAEERASVCVAAVPSATTGAKSLSNATASTKPYEFTVKVDAEAPVTPSHSVSVLVANLPASSSHRVNISQGGSPTASFRFRFTDYKSNDLCLWFNPLYESWSLWPMSASKGKCACATPTEHGT